MEGGFWIEHPLHRLAEDSRGSQRNKVTWNNHPCVPTGAVVATRREPVNNGDIGPLSQTSQRGRESDDPTTDNDDFRAGYCNHFEKPLR